MQPPPEQFLEWTFQHRRSGMYVPHFFVQLFLMLLIGISVTFLMEMIPIPRGAGLSGTALIVFLVMFGALPIILLMLLIEWDKMPKRKLRVNRQAITLTDTNAWGAKERRMSANGAKISAVHLDFFERLFTFDLYRIDSAYHIEIARIGETFLFPCNDEREQSQIIKQIKEFLSQ